MTGQTGACFTVGSIVRDGSFKGNLGTRIEADVGEIWWFVEVGSGRFLLGNCG